MNTATVIVIAALILIAVGLAVSILNACVPETPEQKAKRLEWQAQRDARREPAKFYVVNAGRGSSRATHIMHSHSAYIPNANPRDVGNIIVSVATGYVERGKPTLCGLPATRHADVFKPAEVSCRECRRRWEQATAGGAA